MDFPTEGAVQNLEPRLFGKTRFPKMDFPTEGAVQNQEPRFFGNTRFPKMKFSTEGAVQNLEPRVCSHKTNKIEFKTNKNTYKP